MSDWMITIGREKKFTPNPQEVLGGDVIFWRNDDSVPHRPAPMQNGKPIEDGFMDDQIPQGGTSTYFSPANVDKAQDIEYCCAIHPEEKGIIRVLKELAGPPPDLTT